MKNPTLIKFMIVGMGVTMASSTFAQNYAPRYRSTQRQGAAQQQYSQPAQAYQQYGSTANYQAPWYQTLAKDRSHNFGIVPRASKQERIFEFVNTTDADIFLTNIRTSCGCTKPKVLTPQVRPGEKAQIQAVFDTLHFYGQRGATLTVSIQKSSQYGELQFTVKGNIRRDVVLNPGEVVFDDVSVSEPAQRTVQMLYAGNPNWKVTQVKSTNSNVAAEAVEIERNTATGRVTYNLVVTLADTQDAGSFSEVLTIATNDPKTNGMPVTVQGNVNAKIEVAAIELGTVSEGQTIQKKLILRSTKAIAIKHVLTNDPRIKFEPTQGEKTLHILSYSVDTSKAGQIEKELTIMTNDPTQPEAKVPFSVQIVPATTVKEPIK